MLVVDRVRLVYGVAHVVVHDGVDFVLVYVVILVYVVDVLKVLELVYVGFGWFAVFNLAPGVLLFVVGKAVMSLTVEGEHVAPLGHFFVVAGGYVNVFVGRREFEA